MRNSWWKGIGLQLFNSSTCINMLLLNLNIHVQSFPLCYMVITSKPAPAKWLQGWVPHVRNSSDLHPFYQETHVHFPQVVLDSPSQFEDPWGGNFDIIILVDSPSHFEVAKGLVMLISSYPCGQSKSIWRSLGVGKLRSSYPGGQSKSNWSSMGVGSQFEAPWGWECWYHLILVDSPSQTEVPWG